jgi:hypothetical protein
MNIGYSYSVVEDSGESLLVRYKSSGKPDIDVYVRRPYTNETFDGVAQQYAPIQLWTAQELQVLAVPLGTAGEVRPKLLADYTLEERKEQQLQALAFWRYTKEVSGVFLNGAKVRTDRESQSQIASAYVSLKEGLVSSVNFKTANGGWIALTAAEIAAVARAVAEHVQKWFTLESVIADQIKSAPDIATLEAIEFESFVPTHGTLPGSQI